MNQESVTVIRPEITKALASLIGKPLENPEYVTLIRHFVREWNWAEISMLYEGLDISVIHKAREKADILALPGVFQKYQI